MHNSSHSMTTIKAPRGIQPFNAVYDVQSTLRDLNRQTTSGSGRVQTQKTLYDPPTMQADRSIITGEVLYTPARCWFSGSGPDPAVRSVLNGVMFKSTGGDKTKDLRKSIRYVSIALKHVMFDTPNIARGPSDQPVGAVSGHMTITNLGMKHIELGQAIQAVMPSVENVNQYNDGVTKVSDNRKAVAYEALQMHHTLKGAYDASPAIRNAIAKICEKAASVANDPDSRNYDPAVTKQGLIDRFEAALNNDDIEEQLFLDSVLAVSRAATMFQFKNYICTALTGADPGLPFKGNVQPLTNIVSRAVDPEMQKQIRW